MVKIMLAQNLKKKKQKKLNQSQKMIKKKKNSKKKNLMVKMFHGGIFGFKKINSQTITI